MSLWTWLKRIGVALFIGGLGAWIAAELIVSDQAVAGRIFMVGWVSAIVGALLNGIAVVREHFFS